LTRSTGYDKMYRIFSALLVRAEHTKALLGQVRVEIGRKANPTEQGLEASCLLPSPAPEVGRNSECCHQSERDGLSVADPPIAGGRFNRMAESISQGQQHACPGLSFVFLNDPGFERRRCAHGPPCSFRLPGNQGIEVAFEHRDEIIPIEPSAFDDLGKSSLSFR